MSARVDLDEVRDVVAERKRRWDLAGSRNTTRDAMHEEMRARRTTELLEAMARELAELRSGIVLPGWDCPACKAFNGDAKERLTACRACGGPRT